MRRGILIAVLVSTLLIFSGCSQRVQYLEGKCPKLQTYKVKTISIKYEIRDKR